MGLYCRFCEVALYGLLVDGHLLNSGQHYQSGVETQHALLPILELRDDMDPLVHHIGQFTSSFAYH